MDTFISHYAHLFNTYNNYVKYYHELTDEQKMWADSIFSAIDMNYYVYCLSSDKNSVVARRLIHRNDPMLETGE